MSSLDRNFVFAKICILVKIYVFNMDTYMLSLFSIMYHIHPVMHIPSYHHPHFIRYHRFFFPRKRRAVSLMLIGKCLLFGFHRQ